MVLGVFIWGSLIYIVTSFTVLQRSYPDGDGSVQDYEEDPESGPFIEGDIMRELVTRNGIPLPRYIWENGAVHYSIETTFSQKEIKAIQSAMKKIQDVTCILFQAHTNPPDTISFVFIVRAGIGCSSDVGKQAVVGQNLVLSPMCFENGGGRIIHQLIHSIGFYHEHTREDRNKYVKIVEGNIKDGMESHFAIRASNPYGMPYDYDSIMHYSKYAWSKQPGQAETIHVSQSGAPAIGQRTHISNIDAKKINAMYKKECSKSLGGLARRYRAYLNLNRNQRRWL